MTLPAGRCYPRPGGNALEYRHFGRKPIVDRVSRAMGHLASVKRMLDEGRSCGDILQQLSAVRSALEQVARLVFEDHLDSCVRAAARDGDPQGELDELKGALQQFFRT